MEAKSQLSNLEDRRFNVSLGYVVAARNVLTYIS